MSAFIDIFYSAASNAYPYIAFIVNDNGIITSSVVHHQIAAVAAWCKTNALPVRAYDRQVRAELREYGIDAQPYKPYERIVG
jgi:hypothetical protein